MSLIDFFIAPHYRSNHPESPAIEDVVGYFQSHNLNYKTLQDGEALLYRFGEFEKVGYPSYSFL